MESRFLGKPTSVPLPRAKVVVLMNAGHVRTHVLLVAKELATQITLQMVAVAVLHVAVVAQRGERVEHLVAGDAHALLVHSAHVIR